MATPTPLSVEDVLRVNGSRRFAAAMAAASPFASLADALLAARRIWLNEVDVNGWLEAFAAHPAIGTTSPSVSKWSKEEQSAALSTATDSTAQELAEWNARYREKFGFVFMICASGRTAPEVLAELKRRYTNRPIVELENAAQEELKITELRLAKLFSSEPTVTERPTIQSDKAAEFEPSLSSSFLHDYSAFLSTKFSKHRIRIIGAHLGALPQPRSNKAPEITGSSNRSRPPITTHVLDVARGSPGSGIEVHLEMWKDVSAPPSFGNKDFNGWATLGSSVTNNDGRSGQLMDIVDNVAPGFYRISFNTGKYAPAGFFPYVSIIFEIKENQTAEHFHVPLLHSPFSFTTYRGS
ncbi:uric acid degradation bifunctional protein TTL isoform X1 [Panicum miliaceum]|uniref:Uric acid degradation bifunctional protein TTL isoform X1 n=1 Tax=Panicum miliaceum TaxID=4540 RepID=A0A3L6TW10_PANMI|nr:uric acid degradation bifunctional protein TTL isoform X1 [Panicum miliaceum]